MVHSFEDNAKKFIEMLNNEKILYEDIRNYSKMQTEAISDGNQTELEKILLRKQEIMLKIEDLNKELGPLKKEWELVKDDIDQDTQNNVFEAVNEVKEVLRTIIEAEDKDRKLVEEMKKNLKNNIKKVQVGKKLGKAYGIPKETKSRFKDKNY